MIGIVRARTWSPAICEILTSHMDRMRPRSGKTAYRWVPLYLYEFGGQRWTGERTSFFEDRTSRRAFAAVLPGSRVPCFVNPEAPAESVLDRGPSWSLLWALLPIAFMALGMAVLLGPARGRHRPLGNS